VRSARTSQWVVFPTPGVPVMTMFGDVRAMLSFSFFFPSQKFTTLPLFPSLYGSFQTSRMTVIAWYARVSSRCFYWTEKGFLRARSRKNRDHVHPTFRPPSLDIITSRENKTCQSMVVEGKTAVYVKWYSQNNATLVCRVRSSTHGTRSYTRGANPTLCISQPGSASQPS
jgi:hypothetical protein